MHSIIKLLITSFVLFSLSTHAHCEEKEESSHRFFFWGFYFHELVTLGQYSSFTLYPMGGIKPAEKTMLGVACKYRYSKTPNYNAHDISIAPFVSYVLSHNIHRYFPFGFFVQTDYELINYDKHGQYDKRHNVHLCWIGGGLKQAFGNNNSLNIMLMFELTGHKRAPKSPAFKISLLF